MKKKVLLLGDDMRLNSGIGTMSKEIIEGTLDRFDWVQIGGAVTHPHVGQIADLSEEYQKSLGIKDAYLKIYATNGYGNADALRQVISIEKPDIILHFTDPRYWGWLYQMEHELRQHIPLGYINIWDDLPFPRWNEDFYESCDLLMAISKQTYNINKHVCQRKQRVEGKDLFYTPHGIDERKYFPIPSTEPDQLAFRNKATNFEDFEFIAFLNSRNIRRKGISDLLAGFKQFRSNLPKDKQDKVALILHTDPIDNNGTDLPVVADALDPEMKVIFSTQAMMSGTPTIATVVGGLQDQMGFTNKSGEYITIKDFTENVPSNSTGLMGEKHGCWTYPLWPNQSIQGSPSTPYIYDSRPTIEDITTALKFWYDAGPEERKRCGSVGRDWAIENGFSSKNMCDTTATAITTCLENYTPRQRYAIIDTATKPPKYPIGDLI